MTHLLGLSLESTGVVALVYRTDGRVLASAATGYPLGGPRAHWCEQDPEHFYQAAQTALRTALRMAGVQPGQIAAIGVCSQLRGTVFLDARGQSIRPALIGDDPRSAVERADLAERLGPGRTGVVTGCDEASGTMASALQWLRRAEPAHAARVARILSPKDYLIYRLTGRAVTDAADASRSGLFDLAARRWSLPLLSALEVPLAWLPEVAPDIQIAGSVTAAAGAELAPGTAVVSAGSAHAAAALFGEAQRPGMAVCTIADSSALIIAVSAPTSGHGLAASCQLRPGAYLLSSEALVAQGFFRRLRESISSVAPAMHELDMLDATARMAPGAAGLRFRPVLMPVDSPTPAPLRSGEFIGMTERHQPAHLVQAVIEGVALALRAQMEQLERHGVAVSQIGVGGALAITPAWTQSLANLFDRPVLSLDESQCALRGAAIAAALALGVDPAPLARGPGSAQMCRAEPSARLRYDALYAASLIGRYPLATAA